MRRGWAVLLVLGVAAASGLTASSSLAAVPTPGVVVGERGGFVAEPGVDVARRGGAVPEPGGWTWPLAGPRAVSRPFSPPPTRYAAGHRGADLPAKVAAPVLSAAAGRVSYAGMLGGRGVVVVVHGDLRTTYEPVAASVAVGAQVAAGAEIGLLQAGHAGCPAAACLHWGLRRGADYLDPVRAVDHGPVRLLPLGPVAVPRAGDVPGAGGGLPDEAADGVTGPADGALPAVPLPNPSPRPQAPAPVAGAWSLRAVQTPAGLAVLAALVLGIGLLARRRPGPDDPAGSSAGATGPVDQAGPDALVLQLDSERLRRRAG